MEPRPEPRATRVALAVLLVSVPLALAMVLGGVPGPAWAVVAFAAGVSVASALATVTAVVVGLRDGSLSALLLAGASATLAGGALGVAGGSGAMPIPIAASAAMTLAAAVSERLGTLVHGRGARVGVAAVVILAAEAAVVAGIAPGVAAYVAGAAVPVLVAAALAAAGGAGVVVGRPLAGAAATLGAASVATIVTDPADAGFLVGLGLLAGAALLMARSVLDAADASGPAGTDPLPSLAEQLPDAVLRFDGRLQLRSWNAAASTLLGLDEASAGVRLDDLLGISLPQLPIGDEAAVRAVSMGGLELSIRRESSAITIVIRDGERTPEGDRLGRELRATIEELLRARRTIELQRAELERAAAVDPLTGVASRTAILDRLRIEVAQARRYQHPVAVILLDVDRFGAINGSHGLDGGDSVLREVALRVRLRVREADALGRAGSDGLLAVLPHTDEAGAVTFADALRRRIGQRPVTVGDASVAVTVSIGVAVMRPGEDLDLDGIMARVDEALASARGAGGDRIALDRAHGLVRLERRGAAETPSSDDASEEGA